MLKHILFIYICILEIQWDFSLVKNSVNTLSVYMTVKRCYMHSSERLCFVSFGVRLWLVCYTMQLIFPMHNCWWKVNKHIWKIGISEYTETNLCLKNMLIIYVDPFFLYLTALCPRFYYNILFSKMRKISDIISWNFLG